MIISQHQQYKYTVDVVVFRDGGKIIHGKIYF